MRHPVGKVISPHVHNPVPREVHYTQEVLFIRKGKLQIDFYNKVKDHVQSAYKASHSFHQNEVRNDPELLN
ncbi:hypothetical protein ACFLZ5_03695 [Thermodesulfobacteriota bacterium]